MPSNPLLRNSRVSVSESHQRIRTKHADTPGVINTALFFPIYFPCLLPFFQRGTQKREQGRRKKEPASQFSPGQQKTFERRLLAFLEKEGRYMAFSFPEESHGGIYYNRDFLVPSLVSVPFFSRGKLSNPPFPRCDTSAQPSQGTLFGNDFSYLFVLLYTHELRLHNFRFEVSRKHSFFISSEALVPFTKRRKCRVFPLKSTVFSALFILYTVIR